MDAFGALILIAFVLLSLLTRGAGRGRGGPGARGPVPGPRGGGMGSRGRVPGPAAPGDRSSAGAADAATLESGEGRGVAAGGEAPERTAADLVPDDLWQVLTGEPRRRDTRGEQTATGSRMELPPRSGSEMQRAGAAEASERGASQGSAWSAPRLPERPTLGKRPSELRQSPVARRTPLDTAGMPLPETGWNRWTKTHPRDEAGQRPAAAEAAHGTSGPGNAATSTPAQRAARTGLGLARPGDVRRAFVLAEVLGPPRSLD